MATTTSIMPKGFDAGIINRQWASRPPDERFVTLEDLRAFVEKRTEDVTEITAQYEQLHFGVGGGFNTDAQRPILQSKSGMPVDFTHHSFSQICSLLGAPAGHLRQRTPGLVARYLNECAEQSTGSSPTKLLLLPPTRGSGDGRVDGDPGEVRAFTSETYGRIWDLDVVNSVIRINDAADGMWQVPASSYASRDPKLSTTLYASSANVFIALVDPDHPIEVGKTADGEPDVLYRGFIAWNSEVGDRTFGLCTFLYRYICDNRLIWGPSDVTQLLIRHTKNGPYRFERDAVPTLAQYAESSSMQIEGVVRRAKEMVVLAASAFESEEDKAKSYRTWLKGLGYTERAIQATEDHIEKAGVGYTLWETVQGLTAYAHTIAFADARVDLERKATGLLEMVRE